MSSVCPWNPWDSCCRCLLLDEAALPAHSDFLFRSRRRHIEQSTHAVGGENHVAAIWAAHQVKIGLVANSFGMADQKLLAARELDQECAESTTPTEAPAGGVPLVLG